MSCHFLKPEQVIIHLTNRTALLQANDIGGEVFSIWFSSLLQLLDPASFTYILALRYNQSDDHHLRLYQIVQPTNYRYLG